MARALSNAELSVWRKRISRHGESGLTIAAFCRRESVSVASFHYWKRKLGANDRQAGKVRTRPLASDRPTEAATFVQVPLPQPRGLAWIEIVTADGTQIRLPHQSLGALEVTLAALAGRNGDRC